MDKLEQLIKSLQEVKELLSKDAADPKLAPKEVKVKQLKAQVEAGTYKPDPKKIAEKMLSKEEMDKRCWEGYKPTPGKKAYEDGSCEPVSKEELVCSKNGQWDIIEKARMTSSVYNAGTHPMKGRESKVGNFPHYDYDTSASHEDNVKQAKAHFDKHKVKLNDVQFDAHMKQAKARAVAEES